MLGLRCRLLGWEFSGVFIGVRVGMYLCLLEDWYLVIIVEMGSVFIIAANDAAHAIIFGCFPLICFGFPPIIIPHMNQQLY